MKHKQPLGVLNNCIAFIGVSILGGLTRGETLARYKGAWSGRAEGGLLASGKWVRMASDPTIKPKLIAPDSECHVGTVTELIPTAISDGARNSVGFALVNFALSRGGYGNARMSFVRVKRWGVAVIPNDDDNAGYGSH